MDSIAKPKDIVAKVKSMGQTALAISDHGTTSGLIETYKICKKQGIHFIFACEHYLVNDVTIRDGEYKHIMLFAKNNEGYKNLLKITSIAHHNFYRKPRIDLDILKEHSDGIAVSTACLGGWIRSKNIDNQNIPNLNLLEQMISIFPNDLWVEIHTYSTLEQQEWNKQLVNIAQQYNLPLIAACDAHYVNKEDSYVHKMWLTQGKEKEDGYYQTPDFYLHSEQEVYDTLSYLPKDTVSNAISNTQVLADSCQVEIIFGEHHYPQVDVPDKRKAIEKILHDNWIEKLPNRSEWKAHADRIKNVELPILEKADYFPYFLIMYDFMKHCKENNIPVYYDSRGSAGGCDTAFIMDIHKTNAVKYDLMFARFLHEERQTPCDIDVDISRIKRGEAIEYLKNKYGHDRVFQARTYGYMAARGALKRAGNSLGYDPQFILELSKKIPKFSDEEEEFKGEDKEKHILDEICTPKIKDIINLAKSFVGILQSFSVHPSAVIVFPDDPNNYTAIEKSGDNYVTAYEFHTLESLGILKLDVLGIKTIDVIYNTLNIINEPIDIINLPLDDKKTFDMLCAGNTAGVFQIEGNGFTQLVKQVQPRHFEDLAPLMAVYRPAIIQAGLLQTYINRKTGKEPIEYLHSDLEPLLKGTMGMAIYQENIIEIAKVICGYTPGQADMIRRACGRKLPEEMAKIKPDFIERGVNNGYDKEFIAKLWELIEFFAGYGFGKAHTYAYGYRAYITAYLKANYTKEFMTSLLNSEEKQEDVVRYIEECKKFNITILPPDITKMNTHFTLENGSIRFGLHFIKGIGNNLNLSNVTSREQIFTNNNKRVLEALIKAGAMDSFGKREELLALIEPYKDYLKKLQHYNERLEYYKGNEKKTKEWQSKLNLLVLPKPTPIEQYDYAQGELEVLSYTFTSPFIGYDRTLCNNRIRLCLVDKFKKTKQKRGKHAGKDMAFVDVTTEQGKEDLVMFANNYQELKEGQVYLLVIEGNKIAGHREAKKV